VPVDKDDRVLLRERTGTETIPVLVTFGDEPLVGEEAILAYLASREQGSRGGARTPAEG
jgi:glutathione S-transferase